MQVQYILLHKNGGGNYPLPPLWGPMLVDTKVTAPKSAKQKKAVEVSTTIQSRQQSDEVCWSKQTENLHVKK